MSFILAASAIGANNIAAEVPDINREWGKWTAWGDRVGVFCFNDDSDTGYVDFFKNK